MSRPGLIAAGAIAVVVFALLAGGVYTVMRYRTYYMPSGSMTPTLQPKQMFVVDQFAYRNAPPRRGDIVIFVPPIPSSNPFTKRVVATPGDRFAIRGGRALLNGVRIDEPYAPEKAEYELAIRDYAIWVEHVRLDRNVAVIPPRAKWTAPDTVPPGCYVVLGDNRPNSEDSHVYGFLCPGQPVPNQAGIHPALVGRAIVP